MEWCRVRVWILHKDELIFEWEPDCTPFTHEHNPKDLSMVQEMPEEKVYRFSNTPYFINFSTSTQTLSSWIRTLLHHPSQITAGQPSQCFSLNSWQKHPKYPPRPLQIQIRIQVVVLRLLCLHRGFWKRKSWTASCSFASAIWSSAISSLRPQWNLQTSLASLAFFPLLLFMGATVFR